MWKSRIDKLPPSQFWADLFQHIRNLYPGAALDEDLVKALRDVWIAEWRNGQSAQDTAKATCSCDGKTIVPSVGAGQDLGKRLARPPKGAKRGDFIAPENLREVVPLANARKEAERLAASFDRVRGAAVKLLQTGGWTAAKAQRLQKLRALLQEIKSKHEAAVAKYEEVRRARRESKQPGLYEKPLGAVGLKLRPDELPEPPPPKQKKPPKEKKPPKDKKLPKEKAPKAEKPKEKAPKEKKPPKAAKASKERPPKAESKKEPARPAWEPPADLPQTGMAGSLTVTVEAVPNPDFAASTDPDGRNRATMRIPARTFPVGTLGAARALVLAFVDGNGLGGGNFPPTAGRVRLDGKPLARISYNGRIWGVDGKWKESGQELDETGKPKDGKDCGCKETKKGSVSKEKAPTRAPAEAPPAGEKPNRGRKPKAAADKKPADKKPADKKPTDKKPTGKTPTDKAPPQPVLSDAEAEELANLFAAASAEDKPK